MSVRAQWEWVLDGGAADRPVGPAFTGRFDAEQWLGEQWRDLAEQGVTSAQLVHEGASVGPRIALVGA